MDEEDTHPSLPPPSLLKGYEYTTFNPTPINPNLPGTSVRPTQAGVFAAMEDLRKVLHPKYDTRRGYQDPEIDLWRRARMEGMLSMFYMFTNGNPIPTINRMPLHSKQQSGWAEGHIALDSYIALRAESWFLGRSECPPY